MGHYEQKSFHSIDLRHLQTMVGCLASQKIAIAEEALRFQIGNYESQVCLQLSQKNRETKNRREKLVGARITREIKVSTSTVAALFLKMALTSQRTAMVDMALLCLYSMSTSTVGVDGPEFASEDFLTFLSGWWWW